MTVHNPDPSRVEIPEHIREHPAWRAAWRRLLQPVKYDTAGTEEIDDDSEAASKTETIAEVTSDG